MGIFLLIVGVLCYLFAIIVFLVAFSASDIQFILAGVFGTCGTVALAGSAITHRLEQLLQLQRGTPQSPTSDQIISALKKSTPFDS